MAKKEPTIADAAVSFLDVLQRCQFTSLLRENRILYTKGKKTGGTFFVIDQSLWNALTEDQDFNEMSRELNPLIPSDRIVLDRLYFARDMENEWIDIPTESMLNDDRIFINIEGFEYKIEINKTIWPVRFKKAEFDNFSYRIFNKPFHAFAIRKKFVGPVDDSSFYLMRVFQII